MENSKNRIVGGDEYTEQAVNAFMESGQHQGYVVSDAPSPVKEAATTVFPDEYPREKIYAIHEAEIDEKVEALVKTMIGHCKSRKKMDCAQWLKRLEIKQLVNKNAFTKRKMPELAPKSFSQMIKDGEI